MLEARNVTFGYPGHEPLYRGFSLQVGADERVALRARSGFGKTTLCQMLAGYLTPSAGIILVDGEPLPRRGPCPVQMIWQHPENAVDPRLRMRATLAEAGMEVDEAGQARDERHGRILEGLGIRATWLSRYPHELSGGELQRFCIARALATRPRYLVADEISTMLDAVTQAQIWRFLLGASQAEGIGMVLVSHSPALTARVATRTLELE